MTIFVITIAEKFALVSQDTMVSALPAGRPAERYEVLEGDAAGAVLPPKGEAPAPDILGFKMKTTVFPSLHMAAGGAGSDDFISFWKDRLTDLARAGARDIADLDREAPEFLSDAFAQLGYSIPTAIYHVGYSGALGRFVGYLYANFNGFRSQRLDRGHSFMPMVDIGHPDYRILSAGWGPALSGRRAFRFHVRVAANQYDSYLAGRFFQGSGIGGQLYTVMIGRRLMKGAITHRFPGYVDQVRALADRNLTMNAPSETFEILFGAR